MASLSAAQIYQIALQAGFPPDAAVNFTAIALAESAGDPHARLDTGAEDSRGLWQINIKPGVRPNVWGDLYDPLTNARAAYDVSEGGRNLRPWNTTHHAAGQPAPYEKHLAEARQAAHEQVSYSTMTASAADSGQALPDHVRPIEDGVLTDSWHAPRAHNRVHEGIDIFAPSGTPIHAVTGGTVVKGFHNSLGGVVVRIQGDDGNYYYYAHLKEGSTDQLQVGQRVSTGQVIGQVGNSGDAATAPPHLHLQVRRDGEWINPYSFLQPFPDLSSLDPATGQSLETGGAGIDDAATAGHGAALFVDSDDDGLSDAFEKLIGTDPRSADTDRDGLSDYQEVMVTRTEPTVVDTDNNGESDAVSVALGHDPGIAQLSPEAQQALAFGDAARPLAAHPGGTGACHLGTDPLAFDDTLDPGA